MRRIVAATVEIFLLLGGLSAAAIAATYPLIRHLGTHLPNDLGDPVLVAWTLGWDAHAFGHAIGQIFDAPNFFPYLHTLMYSDHLIGLAIFTAPVQWLSANPVLTYNAAFIASFVQAGGSMYLLARALTGRRDAAALAAVAYAFTPFRVAHLAHLQWLVNGWLPLSLWALHRYFSTGILAWLLAAAGAYLLQSLTVSYFTYYALLPIGMVAGAEIWRRRPPLWRTVAHVAAAAVLCALILAPVVSAYYHAREDRTFVRKPSEIAAFSADLGDYFRGHHNVALWRHARHGTSEHELFPGAIVLVLAGAALFTPHGAATARIRLYAVMAAAAIVLSLGPQPSAWGHQAPVHGPYQLLLDIVPGLDGLRGVSRIGVIVVLALCVMGAFGAVRLLDRAAPAVRPWLAAALALGMVAEGWAAPIPTARFDPLADPGEREAYGFLRASGSGGAVLELPMGLADDPRELRYQYLTLWHGHRLVNGTSSYTPAFTQLLKSEHSPLADVGRLGGAVGLMRAIGVGYVVIHRGAFTDPATGSALTRALEQDPQQVLAEHGFGDTIVFVLAPDEGRAAEAGRWRPVPAAAIRARASHGADRLPLLFDRDRDTRWLTADRQTGNEWIELELDSPRNIGVVRMQTAERSFADYPRDLAIDAVEAAGARTLFHGSVLPAFGRGFATDHNYPTMEITLPDNQARVIRLRQLGATNTLFWSIHELELLEHVQ
jgi:type IV secretory pathway VirB2 component (pilin)